MAWRKLNIRRTPNKYTQIIPLVRSRVMIPQPATRPLDIHSKDLIKKLYVTEDPWWFTMHRRGIKRTKVGTDPLESRAVPRSMIRGTLPERIVYNALVNLLHLSSGVDFTFQSSQEGGRMELGGIVADFLFPLMKFVIQVQGPTHEGFLRARKDEEQKNILADMGFRVFDVDLDVIYNEARFEAWLRNLFNLGGVGGGSGGRYTEAMSSGIASNAGGLVQDSSIDESEIGDDKIYTQILEEIQATIRTLRGG